MERRLSAILAADVVGYTRLIEAAKTEYLGELRKAGLPEASDQI